MIYSIYDTNTGQIISILNVEPEELELNISSDSSYIEGEYHPKLYYMKNGQPVLKPANPYEYGIFNYITEIWEFDNSAASESIRARRNQLLAESDWTDTYSASTRLSNYSEWQTYRQALRDITQQSGYPTNINWPQQPE